MIATIDLSQGNNKISIGAKGILGLTQEIRTLLSTRKGSVPLDRDFGVSWNFVDEPVNSISPLIIAEYATQIEKYIPRVQVAEILFNKSESNIDGIMYPRITLKIRKEFENDFK